MQDALKVKTHSYGADVVSDLVLKRFITAYEFKHDVPIASGKSFAVLVNEARLRYFKTYTPEQLKILRESTTSAEPYHCGITQEKVQATTDKLLSVSDPANGAMFTIKPSLDSKLNPKSIKQIKKVAKAQIVERLRQNGIQPEYLESPEWLSNPAVRSFIEQLVEEVEVTERALINNKAEKAANIMLDTIQARLLDSGYKEALDSAIHDTVLCGVGVVKYPHYVNNYKNAFNPGGTVKKEQEIKAVCKYVPIEDIYVSPNAKSLEEADYVIEVYSLSKQGLQMLLGNKEYNKDAVQAVLDLCESQEDWDWIGRFMPDNAVGVKRVEKIRTRLAENAEKVRKGILKNPPSVYDVNGVASSWVKESIDVLQHTGFIVGSEIRRLGVVKDPSSINDYKMYKAEITVCGGYVIRFKLFNEYSDSSTRYFSARLNAFNVSVYHSLGVATKVSHDEDSTNTYRALKDQNIVNSVYPVLVVNSDKLKDYSKDVLLKPGAVIETSNSLYDYSAQGKTLEVLPLSSNTAPMLQHIEDVSKRQADYSSGIARESYTFNQLGKSSLGEYAKRAADAMDSIHQYAKNIDKGITVPLVTLFYNMLVAEMDAKDVVLDLQVVGISGILKDQSKEERDLQLLQIIQNGVSRQVLPPEVERVMLTNIIKERGISTSAFGLEDPLFEKASVESMLNPKEQQGEIKKNPVKLDGRSLTQMGG